MVHSVDKLLYRNYKTVTSFYKQKYTQLNTHVLFFFVQVNTYIEDCIAQKDPLIKILRLVCMQSVCNNGLKQKVLDFYKREILQVQPRFYILHLFKKNCRSHRFVFKSFHKHNIVCVDVRIRAHSDPQQLGEDRLTQTADQHKEQLSHHQENTQAVDGGCKRTG